MAKKSRRARTRAPSAPKSVRVTQTRRLAPEPEVRDVDFSEEYRYVVDDLKRIFVIAAVLMVLLVILALVIA